MSAVGLDRPGIVAAVSGALVEKGCNIEDSSMTILQGWFAILLVVDVPGDVARRELEETLEPAARRFELVVSVRPLGEGSSGGAARGPSGEAWTLSIHGADRPGIVHGVTEALANAGGNVVDLSTHLVGTAGSPVYVMTLRAMLPSGGQGETAAESVRRASSALGVQCTVHRDDPEVL